MSNPNRRNLDQYTPVSSVRPTDSVPIIRQFQPGETPDDLRAPLSLVGGGAASLAGYVEPGQDVETTANNQNLVLNAGPGEGHSQFAVIAKHDSPQIDFSPASEPAAGERKTVTVQLVSGKEAPGQLRLPDTKFEGERPRFPDVEGRYRLITFYRDPQAPRWAVIPTEREFTRYVPEVVGPSFAANYVWLFDEGGGTTISPYKGSVPLTVGGLYEWREGGNALRLIRDGTSNSGRVRSDVLSFMNLNNPYTVMVFGSLPSVPNVNGNVMTFGNASTTEGSQALQITTDSRLRLLYRFTGGVLTGSSPSTNQVDTQNNMVLTLMRSHATGQRLLYVREDTGMTDFIDVSGQSYISSNVRLALAANPPLGTAYFLTYDIHAVLLHDARMTPAQRHADYTAMRDYLSGKGFSYPSRTLASFANL